MLSLQFKDSLWLQSVRRKNQEVVGECLKDCVDTAGWGVFKDPREDGINSIIDCITEITAYVNI